MKKGSVILADSHQVMLAGERILLESIFESVFMVADEASLIAATEKLKPEHSTEKIGGNLKETKA